MITCTVYLANCTPFNGAHAVLFYPDGSKSHGYAWHNGGQLMVSLQALCKNGKGMTTQRRTAPEYLGCAWPGHWWEPVDPVPAAGGGEMTPEQILNSETIADVFLAVERSNDPVAIRAKLGLPRARLG